MLSVALAANTKRLNIENRIAENECEQYENIAKQKNLLISKNDSRQKNETQTKLALKKWSRADYLVSPK